MLFILSSFIVKSTISSSVVNTTNFSQHIAPNFYANCTGCYHTSGVGPCLFSMINYQDAYNMRFAIQTSMLNGEMPPVYQIQIILVLDMNEYFPTKKYRSLMIGSIMEHLKEILA
mgnify:FL=1